MSERVDSLAELIRLALDARALDTHTALPCKVLAYNAATQRAQMQPLVTRPLPTPSNPVTAFLYEVLPVLHEVPVVCGLRGGGCSITLPVLPGDTFLVVFCEADIAGWLATGQLANPDHVRRHGLAGGVAVCGLGADLEPLVSAVDPGIVLTADTIKHGSIAAALALAIAELVELRFTELVAPLINTPPVANDGGAAIQTAVKNALSAAGWTILTGQPPTVGSTKVLTDG